MPADANAKPKAKKPGFKVIQTIALDPHLADVLEKHKVRKPRVVDKIETLEKWIAGKRWVLNIEQHKNDGTKAIITVPGPDGDLDFAGSDATMALAITKALVNVLETGPRQGTIFDVEESADDDDDDDAPDPAGADLPLMQSAKDQAWEAKKAETREKIKRAAAEDQLDAATVVSTNSYDGDRPLEFDDIAQEDAEFWAENEPSVLAWQETGEREGWRIQFGFVYDPDAGTITNEQSGALVWTRQAPLSGTAAKPDATIEKPDAEISNGRRRVFPSPEIENLWTGKRPTAIEIEDDPKGGWKFYTLPGFVFVSGENAIYNAVAQKVWTQAFPVLGTVDRPPLPIVDDLADELRRRETIASALYEAGLYASIFVDTDTLEYCIEQEDIESGDKIEVTQDEILVETAYAAAVDAGTITHSFAAAVNLQNRGVDGIEDADGALDRWPESDSLDAIEAQDADETPAEPLDVTDPDFDADTDPDGLDFELGNVDRGDGDAETDFEVDGTGSDDQYEPDLVAPVAAPGEEPPGCDGILSGKSGQRCNNDLANPVDGIGLNLCSSHLGYVRKFGSLRIRRISGGDELILWHNRDGQSGFVLTSVDSKTVIARAPDTGKTRTYTNGHAPAPVESSPQSPETIRAALDGLGVTWTDSGRPELPPAGRGRKSKARTELEDRFIELRERYLALMNLPADDRIVNGGILPNVGADTPAFALEEIIG